MEEADLVMQFQSLTYQRSIPCRFCLVQGTPGVINVWDYDM
jgi:hypothetical protein